jgi:hypothetical protein
MNPLLLEIARNRKPVEQVLLGLDSDNPAESLAAGQKLVATAKNAGLSMRDYCRLAIDPNAGEFKGSGLNGYEVALAHLGLPFKDDLDQGIVLQAASETFQFKPGTRAFFPEVIDDVVQWKYRQSSIENVSGMLANSRGTNSVELITRVVDDKAEDYQQTGVIAEGARIPIRTLKTDSKSVTFHKFGGGYEFTYEFERRISLDIVTPYANRIEREVQIGQVGIVTDLLINGDGVNPAASVTNASALGLQFTGHAAISAGRMNWEIFLKWLIARAQAGVPIDTVLGNWDMYFEWERMFATPAYNAGVTMVDVLAKAGVQTAIDNPRFNQKVSFEVSSAAPASKLVGFIKGETVEELVENGSDIEESVRSVENQKVRYVKTKNAGYRLVFADTRDILNLDAVAANP